MNIMPKKIPFMPNTKYRKITQALNYLADHQEKGELDKLKAIKLIWAADRYHLRKYGRPVTWDTYEAMKLGPVGSTTMDIVDQTTFLNDTEREYSEDFIKPTKGNNYKSLAKPDTKVFSESDIEALGFALTAFNNMSGLELADLSHRYPEWSKHENILDSGKERKVHMGYMDFFENPKDFKADVFSQDKESLEVSKDIFQETEDILRAQEAISYA
jgi:uncharacterized phage-associated protein